MEKESSRITFKHSQPNPLFQEWLHELHEEALEKGSKLEPMLKEALSSLSKYPLPLRTGAECAILKGFDKRLCLFLDKRLEVYNFNNNIHSSPQTSRTSSPLPTETQETSSKNEVNPSIDSDDLASELPACVLACAPQLPIPQTSQSTSQNKSADLQQLTSQNIDVNSELPYHNNPQKRVKQSRTTKPSYRTGGYAILIALLEYSKENPNDPSLKKEELIERAQQHCDESFTRPKPESFYTAWSNMTRMIKKGFVVKSVGKKATYSLTELGLLIANDLLDEAVKKPTDNDIIFNNAATAMNEKITEKVNNFNANTDCTERIEDTSPNNSENIDIVEMLAGSFDVILLIDKHETSGISVKDPTVAKFKQYPDLKHEYRSLKLGDYTWIARHRTNNQELILPYIVERKRMDDLGASIKDGRYHEQKFRLRKCGLKNIIYVIENYGSNKHVGLPVQSLMQALANIRVQDGFKVHITDSLNSSVRFLAIMTKRLTIEYKDKNLRGCNRKTEGEMLMTFKHFNESSVKNKAFTITETFIKLLIQLKGVSVEKALAITSIYKTPSALIEAYEKCNQKDGEMLLANLKFADSSRNVGPSVSKHLYQFFSNRDLK